MYFSQFKAGFSAGAESCKDYTNDNLNAENMNVAPMDSEDEDGAGAMCIEGSIELTMDIKEGAMVRIDLFEPSRRKMRLSQQIFSVVFFLVTIGNMARNKTFDCERC